MLVCWQGRTQAFMAGGGTGTLLISGLGKGSSVFKGGPGAQPPAPPKSVWGKIPQSGENRGKSVSRGI